MAVKPKVAATSSAPTDEALLDSKQSTEGQKPKAKATTARPKPVASKRTPVTKTAKEAKPAAVKTSKRLDDDASLDQDEHTSQAVAKATTKAGSKSVKAAKSAKTAAKAATADKETAEPVKAATSKRPSRKTAPGAKAEITTELPANEANESQAAPAKSKRATKKATPAEAQSAVEPEKAPAKATKAPATKPASAKTTAKRQTKAAPDEVSPRAAATSVAGTAASLFGIAPYQPAPNEDYMSSGQLAHFRQILQAWRNELMVEVDRTVNYMQDESAALPDINDRATQEEEFAIELRTRDRERKLIRKIEQSITAIDENEDYGYCETCGIEIGLRRLEARPTATQCIDCKTLSEIKERQNLGG